VLLLCCEVTGCGADYGELLVLEGDEGEGLAEDLDPGVAGDVKVALERMMKVDVPAVKVHPKGVRAVFVGNCQAWGVAVLDGVSTDRMRPVVVSRHL